MKKIVQADIREGVDGRAQGGYGQDQGEKGGDQVSGLEVSLEIWNGFADAAAAMVKDLPQLRLD